MSDSTAMAVSFPHRDLQRGGVSITSLHPRQIEVHALPDGERVLTILDNGRQIFQASLDPASAAHLAGLLRPEPSEAA